MDIENKVEEYTKKLLAKNYLGRHVSYTAQSGGWTSPWKIHDRKIEGGTHVIVDVIFYFDTHYCPSEDSYSRDPGQRTYSCGLTVKHLNPKTLDDERNKTLYYTLGDLYT